MLCVGEGGWRAKWHHANIIKTTRNQTLSPFYSGLHYISYFCSKMSVLTSNHNLSLDKNEENKNKFLQFSSQNGHFYSHKSGSIFVAVFTLCAF